MSRQDIDRWQKKYASAATNSLVPDPLLEQYSSLLQGPGLALDLACGRGRNSLFLAQLGKTVFAVDGSLSALQGLCQQNTGIHAWVEDLECWQPPAAVFDLIVVNFFLQRSLLPALITALRPQGLLLYQTFNRHVLRERPNFSPAFVLQPGELLAAFVELHVLASNDTLTNTASSSFVLARKLADKAQ